MSTNNWDELQRRAGFKPLDLKESGDLRGRIFSNRWLFNFQGRDLTGCTFYRCSPDVSHTGALCIDSIESGSIRVEGYDMSGETAYAGMKLMGLYLKGVNFENCTFNTLVSLAGSDLQDANLRRSTFDTGDWRHTNFEGADMRDMWVATTSARTANLNFADLRGSTFINSTLGGADRHCTRLDDVLIISTEYHEDDAKLSERGAVYIAPGVSVKHADLSRRNLNGSSFIQTSLEGAVFRYARIHRVIFRESDLQGADFRESHINSVRFEECDLSGADLRGVEIRARDSYDYFRDTCFDGADFRGATLKTWINDKCSFDKTDFRNAALGFSRIKFHYHDSVNILRNMFSSAKLEGAYALNALMGKALGIPYLADEDLAAYDIYSDLRNITLHSVDIGSLTDMDSFENVDFTGADLRGCDFGGMDLWRVTFKDADLRNAKFEKTDVENCDFTGADLTGATYEEDSPFADAVSAEQLSTMISVRTEDDED